MKQLDEVTEFVNHQIILFHQKKLKSLQNLNLEKILKLKNPYLFRAKNILIASELIQQIMDAFLYSSEEKLFGDFLEDLAVFLAQNIFNGWKSTAQGIDLELERNTVRYLVSIKSGPSWGNSSQQRKQEEDFKTAVRVLKQSNLQTQVTSVLGICYGKVRTSYLRGYMKITGQNFWYFISGNSQLYTEIIQPLSYRAKEHNESFFQKKAQLINQFTEKFSLKFCVKGRIDWEKLVQYNSGNLDTSINALL